jgi:hypothetical protein
LPGRGAFNASGGHRGGEDSFFKVATTPASNYKMYSNIYADFLQAKFSSFLTLF